MDFSTGEGGGRVKRVRRNKRIVMIKLMQE
jgi:hypothetical protein